MNGITDYEFEQLLLKMNINKNSNELKRQGKKITLSEKDPEVKALDEFIIQLKRGKLVVDISEEQNLEDFTLTNVILPKLGEVKVYEPSKVSNQRKIDAEKEAIKEENKSASEIENDKEQKTELAKYFVISLKDEDGKPFDLVIDNDGNDIGKIIYDEKGKPSFEMAPELKQKIVAYLDSANVRTFVEKQTLIEEFYLEDLEALERAIQKGIVVPESSKIAAQRALIAKRIKNKDLSISEDDAKCVATLTPKEREIQEEAEERVRNDFSTSHLQTPEQERDRTQEQKQKSKTDEISNKNNPENQDEKENDSVIPECVKDKVEEYCRKNNKIKLKDITAVLIILDTKGLEEATEKSNIDPSGHEVIMIQYSDAVGRPKYIPIQDEADLTNVANDKSFEHLIEPLHKTTGVVNKVEDKKSYIEYTTLNGDEYQDRFNVFPKDMSVQEKERFKLELEKDIKNLEMLIESDPDMKNPETVNSINYLKEKINKALRSVGLPEYCDMENVKVNSDGVLSENDDNDERFDPDTGRLILTGSRDI